MKVGQVPNGEEMDAFAFGTSSKGSFSVAVVPEMTKIG